MDPYEGYWWAVEPKGKKAQADKAYWDAWLARDWTKEEEAIPIDPLDLYITDYRHETPFTESSLPGGRLSAIHLPTGRTVTEEYDSDRVRHKAYRLAIKKLAALLAEGKTYTDWIDGLSRHQLGVRLECELLDGRLIQGVQTCVGVLADRPYRRPNSKGLPEDYYLYKADVVRHRAIIEMDRLSTSHGHTDT